MHVIITTVESRHEREGCFDAAGYRSFEVAGWHQHRFNLAICGKLFLH
jgi:hypothetical protein